MNTTTENYCIKDGYRARSAALTVESDPGTYWTPERIDVASLYQAAVYDIAVDCAERMGGSLRIADVGCGYPVKTLRLQPFARRLTCFDQPTMREVIARDFEGLEFCAIDLEAPPRVEARFDLIVCADVLEHLLDPDPCLEFLRDHVSAGGIVVLSTPERDLVRGVDCMSSEKPDHVREWNGAEFRAYVTSRGLRVVDHLLLPPRGTVADVGPAVHGAERNGCQCVVATVKP
ncbi:MAG TPA: methyltransferase domain-containing protein [Planctomycetota bacterium]|nr:methyltransferase domain-containing protein [Planctomycetota bacterium]